VNDPVLIDLPASIETERLLLRTPQSGDGPALFDAITESLPDLRRFLASLPWVATEQSLESTETFCRRAQSNFIARTDLPFLAFDKRSGDLVVSCGLHRPVWATPKLEVGYWCRSSRTGRGFVGEAVQALTQLAFEQLHAARVELITDAHNTASRRVAERCGFVLEGILRHERRAPDGTLRDNCVYARLAPASADA
jgi:RimJ/RimL family protein N-acetyltransferase